MYISWCSHKKNINAVYSIIKCNSKWNNKTNEQRKKKCESGFSVLIFDPIKNFAECVFHFNVWVFTKENVLTVFFNERVVIRLLTCINKISHFLIHHADGVSLIILKISLLLPELSNIAYISWKTIFLVQLKS